MKKKLCLNRETLKRLGIAADLRVAGAAAITTINNPSAIDACPSTPVWCPEFTNTPCPEPKQPGLPIGA
jgi:hypothetical protein